MHALARELASAFGATKLDAQTRLTRKDIHFSDSWSQVDAFNLLRLRLGGER